MKKSLQRTMLLLMAGMVSLTMQAAVFTGVSVDITLTGDGGHETTSRDLPASGFTEEMGDLSSSNDTVFTFNSFTAAVIGEAVEVAMFTTIYDASGEPVYDWKGTWAANLGNGIWKSSVPIDVLSGLQKGITYKIEIFFRGKSADGSYFYWSNDSKNYIIKFRYDDVEKEGDKQPFTWFADSTAAFTVLANGVEKTLSFNGDGSIHSGTQNLGMVNSLSIHSWMLRLRQKPNSNMQITSASIQKVVIVPGSQELGWGVYGDGIEYTSADNVSGMLDKKFKGEEIGEDVLGSLEDGKTYGLYFMYQLIDAEGHYYGFGAGNDRLGFIFTKGDPSSGTSNIILDASHFSTDYTFSGTETDANVKYVMRPRNGNPENGFMLDISPVVQGQPAAFVTAMLSDINYWEPAFRRLASPLAGEDLEANKNTKQLTVSNVGLLPNQFSSYEDLKIATLSYDSNYSGTPVIPEGCFSGCNSLDALYIACSKISLGSNALNPEADYVVFVPSSEMAEVFLAYKNNYGCAYTVKVEATLGMGNQPFMPSAVPVRRYDLGGCQLPLHSKAHSGVSIVKMSDGSVRKVIDRKAR